MSLLTPDEKRRFIQSKGVNPDEWDYDDNTLEWREVVKTQPSSAPVGFDTLVTKQSADNSSALGSFGRSAAASVVPTATGLGGGLLAGGLVSLATANPLPIILAGLAGGIGGGYAGEKLQEPFLSEDFKQQLASDYEQHKIASLVGGFAPSALAFNPIRGLTQLPAVASGSGKLLTKGLAAGRSVLSNREEQALINAALNVGTGVGQDIYAQNQGEGDFDYGRLALVGGLSSLFNTPTKLGRKIGFHDIPPEFLTKLPTDKTAFPPETAESRVFTGPDPTIPLSRRLVERTPSTIEDHAKMEKAFDDLLKAHDKNLARIKLDEEATAELAAAESRKRAQDYEAAKIEREKQEIIEQQLEAERLRVANEKRKVDLAVGRTKGYGEEAPAGERLGESIIEQQLKQPEVRPEGASFGKELNKFKKVKAEQAELTKPLTEAEQIQEDYDTGRRYSDEERSSANLLSQLPENVRRALVQYQTEQAQRRGFRVKQQPEIKTPTGTKAGAINLPTRGIQISKTKAGPGTIPHEAIGHGFLEDLKNSAAHRDRELYRRILDIHGGDEERAAIAIERLSAARDFGNVYGTKLDKLKRWWGDIKAHFKTKFKLASDDEVHQFLLARAQHDAPYGTRGELLPTPQAKVVSTGEGSKQKYSEEANSSSDIPSDANLGNQAQGGKPSSKFQGRLDEVLNASPHEFVGMFEGKAMTRESYEIGDGMAKEGADLNVLKDYAERAREQFMQAVKEGRVEEAMMLSTKTQFFREAYEKATNTDSAKDVKYSEKSKAPVFSTALAKELDKEFPFKLRVANDGTLPTENLRAKIEKTLPDIEVSALRVSGLDDFLKGKTRVSVKELREWLAKEGPKVEVHSYGMEGKVSEAKREYDKMTHEWYDTLSESEQRSIERTGQVPTTLDGEDIIKAKRYIELIKQVSNEVYNSPRATSTYETVSALPTNEPMPEWTTSAREANGDNVYNVKYRLKGWGLRSQKVKANSIEEATAKVKQEWGDRADVVHVETPERVRQLEEMEAQNSYDAEIMQYEKDLKDWRKAKRNAEAQGKEYDEEMPVKPDITPPTKTERKNLAPKNVQRVDVVIPQKNRTPEIQKAWREINKKPREQYTQQDWQEYTRLERMMGEEKNLWSPDNLHENLPNTLGWAMIQYKTGPKGEKIAVIVEAQSRWGQAMRERRQELANTPASESSSRALQESRLTQDHPLLNDYNRLILKAAIDQARKEGATHIMISDAETAMMTEGHDTHADLVYQGDITDALDVLQKADKSKGYKLIRETDGSLAIVSDRENTFVREMKEGTFTQAKSSPFNTEFANTKGEKALKENFQWKDAPTQEPGMRLNYDNILPNIAQKLTGDKGQRISLGEHKNAFKSPEQAGISQAELDATVEALRTGQPRKKFLRDNLIFKNPDGSPKTDVSGRLFDISRPGIRRDAGEPFSIAGTRYSESSEASIPLTNHRYGFAKFAEAANDKVRRIDPDIGQGLDNFASRKDQLEAKWRNTLRNDVAELHLNDEESGRVTDYMRAKFRLKGEIPELSPKEQQAVDTITPVYREIRELQNKEGLLVETSSGDLRKGKVSETYIPDMLSDEAIQLFTSKAGSPEYSSAIKEWTDYVVNESEGRLAEPEVRKNIEEYVNALGGNKLYNIEFNALRKAQGYGVPETLRERNLLKIISKYGRRAAADMAYWMELQRDPYIAARLSLPRREGGKSTLEGVESIAGNVDVKNAMKFVYNDFTSVSHPRITSFIRAVTNGLLGLGTGLRNTVQLPALMAPYLSTTKDVTALFSAMGKLREAKRRSLEFGSRSGSMDFDRWHTLENPDRITDTFNKIGEVLRKYQGRDILEQSDRIYTHAVGEEIARGKISDAIGGDKKAQEWLKEFGTLVDTTDAAKLTDEDIGQIAKNFVDRVQGTYDARGLPAGAFESQFAPFFALSRWGIEKSNTVYKDVVRPALEGKNYLPLLTYTLGSFVTGAAIRELNKFLSGKSDYTPSLSESLDKDRKDYAIASIVNLLQMGSYAGIVSDIAKTASDVLIQKEIPRGPVNFPAADLLTETLGENLSDWANAVANGADKFDATLGLLRNIMKSSIQNYRLLDSRILNAEGTDRGNKFRDVRTYHKLSGDNVPPIGSFRGNQLLDKDVREFKQTDDLSEAVQLLPELITKAIERANGDPEKLQAELTKIKQNNYQTMPSPENMPREFLDYFQFLARTQGAEEASNRLSDYLLQNAKNKAKSSLVP